MTSRSEMKRQNALSGRDMDEGLEAKKPIDEIAEILATFFKDDPKKIVYWLLTENLNFGGFSPAELFLYGEIQQKKLAQTMRGMIEGNLP